ncbi:MAG: methylenetetrahydrofolate reductase [Paracoccaceae bacterium]
MLTKNISKLLKNFSIEVMPRTLGKLENIENLWPKNTRVYIAHLEGTKIDDMLVTAKRIKSASFIPMPHFPARIIKDNKVLEDWINRYSELGVNEALLLAGGVDRPLGNLSNSMELLSTGLFEKYGFERLHVAGHPEGNKDIDPNGSNINVMNALKWKQDYSKDTKAKISIATQFLFESKPVIDWANKILSNGITLPINVGIAGPAKLQTMIKFAIACGVGPSLRVLERRAKDITKLLFPFEPTNILTELADFKESNPNTNIEGIHFFPLGGIEKSSDFIRNINTAQHTD